jgi:anti-sigma factor RsiW
VLVLFGGLAWFNPAAMAQGPIVAEITSSHIRSLLANHLLDAPSPDQHTMEPWFAGRIQYAPTALLRSLPFRREIQNVPI